MTEHAHIPLRKRTVGVVHPEVPDDAMIIVDHIYVADGSFACDECGGPGHDPGMVGLLIDTDPDDAEALAVGVELTASEALLLADRIVRAAHLILESAEDRPDVEREAARYAVPDDPSEAEDPEEAAVIRMKRLFQDVCDAWNKVPEGHPSPVKKVARDLGMSAADVAEIIFPPEEFGPWDASQEPDLP